MALRKQLFSLSAEVAALAGRPAPASLAPSGPAGGDLTGSYPNPRLKGGSVTGATVADGSLTGADISDDALTGVKIADGALTGVDVADASLTGADFLGGSIHAASLGGSQVVVGSGVAVAENQVKEAKVSCPNGSRLLSGGFEWKDNAKLGDTIIATGPDIGQNPNTDWEAVGRVLKGGEANELRAVGLCLLP